MSTAWSTGPEYAQKTRTLLEQHGLSSFATLILAPLVVRDGFTPWYDETALPPTMGPANLLVVDGPPASVAAETRYPALPRLMDRLAASATVFLDDAGRPDELRIVQRWTQNWPTFKAEYLPLEKGLAILSRQQ
ncbi:MAG: class I SAM-dependent methyltransferase [Rubrivivax sp.]|nr:class I SAM-dependent methyltransferase [Rubrivivax sp.]